MILFSISLIMFMSDVVNTFDPTQLFSGEITAAAFSMFLVWALLKYLRDIQKEKNEDSRKVLGHYKEAMESRIKHLEKQNTDLTNIVINMLSAKKGSNVTTDKKQTSVN